MDKKYTDLFKELAQATAATAESVMEYDREIKDEQGEKTAMIMRDDFQTLADKVNDEFIMTKKDAAKLLVASMVQINRLKDRIEGLKKAMTGYQTDLVPKLQEIVDNAQSDEEAAKIADKKFIV